MYGYISITIQQPVHEPRAEGWLKLASLAEIANLGSAIWQVWQECFLTRPSLWLFKWRIRKKASVLKKTLVSFVYCVSLFYSLLLNYFSCNALWQNKIQLSSSELDHCRKSARLLQKFDQVASPIIKSAGSNRKIDWYTRNECYGCCPLTTIREVFIS